MKKKPTDKKLNKQDASFDELNNQLGSFGLEPPKRYREADTPHQKVAKQTKKPVKKRVNQENLSAQEKHVVNKKKRKLKKQVRNALMIAGVVLAVILVIVILSLTVLFKIDTIKISGNKKYTNQQITAVLPIQKEDNLFLIKENTAKEKLTTNLPYIYDVEISRKLPSTVEVKILEPATIYYIKNADNTYTYMDTDFKVLELGAKKPPKKGIHIQKLALKSQVAGQVASIDNKDTLKDIMAMMEVVTDLKIKKVTAIYSENVSSNFIVYDNRITIKIGDTGDIENKMYSALSAIEKLDTTNPGAEGTLTSMGGKRVYFTETK